MKRKPRNFFRRFFGQIVLTVNLLVIAWLALCAYAAHVNPLEVEYVPIFSLTTPFAILANAFFVVLWLFSWGKWRSLLSLITLIINYKLILIIFGFNFTEPSDMLPGEDRVKLMTWNIHGQGIFNRPQQPGFEEKILGFLQKEDPDIICMPEFSLPKHKVHTAMSNNIIRNGNYKDYRFQADNTLGKDIFLGTAIFSRYPIYNYKSNRLAPYIYLLQGDFVFSEGDTTRMFFVHLNTFGLSDNDKAYIEEMAKTNTDIKEDLNRSKWFIGKFNYAFIRRAREVEAAREIIEQSPYPVVLCGDFNDLPGSYTYTTFNKNLKHPFEEKGIGFGRTYNRLSPTIRIDHIFYDPIVFKCLGFETPYTTLSDHNPVIANFQIKGASQG